jgi:hypothetical protein
MTPKSVYYALSALGLVLPLSRLLTFLQENGLDPALFLQQLFATHVSAFFAWDVIISGFVLMVFVPGESRRIGLRHWWIPLAGTLLAGVAFGLPLFLGMREGQLCRGSGDQGRAAP